MQPADLGALIKRSFGQVKKLENGQRPVTLELAVPLCKLTGIPLEDLARADDLRLVEEAAPLLGYERRAGRGRRPRAAGAAR
jgi:transcriptional regulator with XRE-family HTH domain